jgi:uncharacterized protein with HEPN domain
MPPRDLDYLRHMLEIAKEAVGRVVERGHRGFDEDPDLRLAQAHRVQTIGEAARRVTTEARQRFPQIPWEEIVGMRHKIVHDYLGVDFDIVWQVVAHDLPELIGLLEETLPPEEPEA